MPKKITKRVVDATKPGPQDVFIWDSELRGFGLRVKPSGVKSYLINYRNAEGRERRFTLGRHGPFTAEVAREKAAALLGRIAGGEDPQAGSVTARAAPTIAQLVQLYLAEGPADKPNKKASSWATDASNLRRHVVPLLGGRKARTLTRKDVAKWLSEVAIGRSAADVRTGPRGRAIVKGGRGTANRSLAVLGAMFAWGVERGYLDANPVTGVKPFRTTGRERFLTDAEMVLLSEAIRQLEQDGIPWQAVTAVRLLMLTGARRNEVMTLMWEYVDFEHSLLRLPDSKTGQKSIPLAPPALAVLSALPRSGQWVFPAVRGDGYYKGIQKIWEQLRRRADLIALEQAEATGTPLNQVPSLEGVRIHDLRHSFASFAAADGASLFLIGKVLGHKQARTTEAYAHVEGSPLHRVAEIAARRVARNLGLDLSEGEEVSPLERIR